MRIEDLKRWHWIVIGLVVGLVLAYASVWAGKNAPPRARDSIGAWEFQENLHGPTVAGNPRVRDITYYRRGNAYVVNLEVLKNRDDTTWVYQPRELYTRTTPFQPVIPPEGVPPGFFFRRTGNRPLKPPTPKYTIADYLQDVAKHNPKVTPRHAWWKESKATMAWWTLGGVVLIGGVWPTVVNLLIGAGFGRRKKEEPEYDLDRFKSEPEAAKGASGPSAEDEAKVRSHLEELEQEVEANLSGAGASADAGAGATPATGGVRTLTGGPLELETAAGPDKPRDYKGEYYPVARPKTGGHEDPHAPSRPDR